ncbi:MAG: iron-containing alcohol dehydrogenase [Wenzhouxiangellaceae bacterium]|nr:iron-containing alcohol dehydrogenase [Wenzhouxiangellaceae bacterium]
MLTLVYRARMLALKGLVMLMPAPRPMLFVGADSTRELNRAIARFGARHVFIVTDATLVELGIIEPIVKHLASLDVRTTVFDRVEPDPDFALIDAGAAELESAGCDAVLGVGGGSPMDAAKVIAARVTGNKPAAELTGIMKLKAPPLPIYAIPTTAGSGSEVTIAAVLSDREAQLKKPVVDPKLVPIAAALDPKLMLGLPPGMTAATGMDAMTHAVESYLSRHAAPDTDRLALAAVRMITRHLPRAYADGSDIEAREAMAIAASYAGSAFTRANVGYIHAIAHQFGARYHTPHGLANAIVMPQVLDYTRPSAEKRMADLARAADVEGQTDAELADGFIQRIRDLNGELGIPDHLADLRRADVPAIAATALKEAHNLYPVPRYMNRRCCEALITRMLPPDEMDS